FDPIESGVRERVGEFIGALICGELDAALARPRYGRAKSDDACSAGIVGHRHGSRTRSLTGSFGKTEITVPRARLQTSDGRTSEWHSKALRAYQRRTLTADALIARGLRRPTFLIVDGAPGLEKAIAAVWDGVPVQRCTVHKHRNLLAHAPERLHEEIGADYTDMIYATTPEDIAARRKAFIRKWRLKHRPVADSLEEAGDRLSSFAQLPPSQGRSARTTNAIERLHDEFKRRIKTQTVLPSAETAAM